MQDSQAVCVMCALRGAQEEEQAHAHTASRGAVRGKRLQLRVLHACLATKIMWQLSRRSYRNDEHSARRCPTQPHLSNEWHMRRRCNDMRDAQAQAPTLLNCCTISRVAVSQARTCRNGSPDRSNSSPLSVCLCEPLQVGLSSCALYVIACFIIRCTRASNVLPPPFSLLPLPNPTHLG